MWPRCVLHHNSVHHSTFQAAPVVQIAFIARRSPIPQTISHVFWHDFNGISSVMNSAQWRHEGGRKWWSSEVYEPHFDCFIAAYQKLWEVIFLLVLLKWITAVHIWQRFSDPISYSLSALDWFLMRSLQLNDFLVRFPSLKPVFIEMSGCCCCWDLKELSGFLKHFQRME